MNKEKIAVLVDTCCDAVSYTHLNNLNIIWPFDMGLSFLFEKVLSKRKTKGKGKML